MVRLTTALLRIPVIKFRKGGGGQAGRPPSTPAAAPASAAPAAAPASVQSQQTVAMSTISDIDLPPRYRRTPLTQEEIDHINGGGIKEKDAATNVKPGTLVFNMPKQVVLHCRKPTRKLIKSTPCGCDNCKFK